MEYMSALQNNFDDFKPSLFELLSEQQLSSLLPPSLRYLLAVATHRHPRYLLRILNSYDELYALVSLLVEGYYLRNFGGSFTENFYSLKRERVLALRDGEVPRAQMGAGGPVRETLKLRDSDIWRNLVIMVGIPYLKRKLDEGYDIHAAPHAALVAGVGGGPRYHPSDDLPHNPTIKQRLLYFYKWFLRNVYPSINGAYYFSILAFNLAYLFDNTKYSSPFLWLIGTRIRRLSPADHKAIAMATAANTPHTGSTAARSRSRSSALSLLSPQAVYPHLLGSLKVLLPASIFALKFLEWWHASDFSRQLAKQATQSVELPAPVVTGIPSSKPAATTATAASEKQPAAEPSQVRKPSRTQSPISSISLLPIFTVPIPPVDPDTSQTPCPICLNPLANPTACQTGYVYCYTCIFRWLNGEHERQIDFMNGAGNGAAWEEDDDNQDDEDEKNSKAEKDSKSRDGNWENGKGRCPVTGRRVLGGTDGLRRVLV
ncbi:ubiquitin-protein ligase peroxin 12 [Arthroderma sp. PD_2]|nr:ubiquitin-protein ligase peroxin 12 [Arthroderma sp. PD_2]